MKKNVWIVLTAAVLVFALTGCGKSAQAGTGNPAASMTDAWDEATELMSGTMLLETTGTPLSAEQKTDLLLLWKGYNAVITSSTSADAEIDALVEQITAVFSQDQLDSIEAMALTADTYVDTLTDAGVLMMGMPFSGEGETGDAGGMPEMPMGGEMSFSMEPQASSPQGGGSSQRQGGGQRPGGGMPGGMAGGGVMILSSGDVSVLTGQGGDAGLSMQATQQADLGLAERTVNRLVMSAVIRYLEQTVDQTTPGSVP